MYPLVFEFLYVKTGTIFYLRRIVRFLWALRRRTVG
jgi:hypothetical protein